jgi:ribosomal protein L40E
MSQERIRAENYFCSECGAKNPSNAVFCMECGMRRDDAHPRLEKKSSNKMRSLGLTPAESLAILYPGTDGKEMLKLTMKDLVVRKIIKIDSTEEKVLLFKKMVHRVAKGENFSTDLKPHEEIFVTPLTKYPELEVKSYFRMVVKPFNSSLTGTSFSKYKNNYVMTLLMEKEYFVKAKKKGIISRDKYELTEDGLKLKKRLDSVFEDAYNLLELADKNPEHAKALMSVLGTHIFIFPYTMDQLFSLKNKLNGVKTKTSKFYPYVLYPLTFLIGMNAYAKYRHGMNVNLFDDDLIDDDFFNIGDGDMDLFEMDILDVFDDFDLDSLDDICDSFDYDGGDDGGFD